MNLPSGATPASRLREVRADGDVVAAAEKLEKVRTPDSDSEVACAHALGLLTVNRAQRNGCDQSSGLHAVHARSPFTQLACLRSWLRAASQSSNAFTSKL